jgi:ribonuclease J
MATAPLRLIPLGGLGEVGKNMMALEYGNDIVVIDCGVLFPEEEMLGVDLVIPDISYLIERRKKVRAILITHGHEDHTGALPYVLPRLKVPVYAPRLAHGLISVKLKEHRLLREADLRMVTPGDTIELGAFRVEYFRVCHSIPDAMGLIIKTPVGTIVHSGDFKIDHTPVDGNTTDLTRIAQAGAEGVLLLLSDSTYAELPGYTPSEQVVGEALDQAVGEATGRVLVTTFASLISRIQQVIDAAEHHRRKVAVVGRSMEQNVEISRKMDYLRIPRGLLLGVREAKKLPPERVVFVTTGSQGEPTSALVRMANRDHRDLQVMPGDTVILSASPVPGNETVVGRTIDNLLRQGARVLYERVATVHVHGHASQEELKMMLNLARPRFFVPVHGEYRHLSAHASLAYEVGIPDSNIFVLEDGDVLELTPTGGKVGESVPAGHIYVDGLSTWGTGNPVLRDRRVLAGDGIVTVIVARDKATGQLASPPKVVSSGFLEPDETHDLFQRVSSAVEKALTSDAKPRSGGRLTRAKVKETAGKLLYKETGRRPMIIPVTIEV